MHAELAKFKEEMIVLSIPWRNQAEINEIMLLIINLEPAHQMISFSPLNCDVIIKLTGPESFRGDLQHM